MKRTFLIAGLALLSFTLVLACGQKEEPTKAQKPAGEQKATAAKEAPAHPKAEHKEHQAKQEVKSQEPDKHEHQRPEPTKPEKNQGQKSDLNQALLAYLAKTKTDPKYINPHQTAQVDLNGDGHQDVLVLLQNPMYFCGTGGCTMLVFKGTKPGFEFVSRSTLIRGPVLVSETKTHGWRDLIVKVSGGGIAAKQVALKYSGSKYPLNPSTLPALPKNQPLKGKKVF
jgi:hypothetical protein